MRAAIAAAPAHAIVQIGNSLPIRVIDQVCGARAPLAVITQRGAAGIDGAIASATGATRAGKPVLLVLGDVSFAHDLGSLVVARGAAAPLAILVIDNHGGQIFAGLPIARAELADQAFERHWLTVPELDPAAIAAALGLRAVTVASALATTAAIATALATPGVTVIHAPVTAAGAHEVRRFAIHHHAPEAALAQLGEPT
jgi:2-succinyl-5-enolpyruvyl-6-hydroxy-3-cyclohexene-1-carboxylate synthase